MSFSLIPDRLYRCYADVSPEELRRLGVTLLLSDLDFTLAPKKTPRPDAALLAWRDHLHANGITLMIVSNNRSGRRVREFCDMLNVPYEGHAGKPSAKGILRAVARAGTVPAHTAMLGDKLLTDVLAAHRAGVCALMVEPAGGARTPWQKILHALQEPFKGICRRRTTGNFRRT